MNLNCKINNVRNIISDDINDIIKTQDILVISDNNNERSKYFLNYITPSTYPKLCIFGGGGNDTVSETFIGSSVYDICKFNEVVQKIASDIEELKITVDVSCLNRNIIAEIFAKLSFLKVKTVKLTVLYTLACYTSPPSGEMPMNELVEPVHPRFSGWPENPEYPVTSIIGLGYEKDKAIGVAEYLESSKNFLFIPVSSESEYLDEVLKHNEILIESTPDRNLLHYQLENQSVVIHQLNSLTNGVKANSKPVFLPFGPKIFFTSALLVALANKEVSVWYVSGEECNNGRDEKAAKIFGYSCEITPSL